MTALLLIYLIGLVVTVCFATVQNGKELVSCRVLSPTSMMTPNWVNFFFLGLLWFAYWPQYYAAARLTKAMPTDPQQRQLAAARALGIPTENNPRG